MAKFIVGDWIMPNKTQQWALNGKIVNKDNHHYTIIYALTTAKQRALQVHIDSIYELDHSKTFKNHIEVLLNEPVKP